ncbi:hypothetical protein MtrunA17_Chr7g0232291 [Medicago truncatula]|uniref:Uncharacterized protein n=1 Tax=Medicago truncatula TaxID=3880 RepID=A0A396GZ82_MEDTR|nr:hypothetical protein MtrunA17_Chr7g0232291 [Medicago truncatula]
MIISSRIIFIYIFYMFRNFPVITQLCNLKLFFEFPLITFRILFF